jgi:hypothetical protein
LPIAAAQARLQLYTSFAKNICTLAAPEMIKDQARRLNSTGPLPSSPAWPCQESDKKHNEVETGCGDVG